MLFVGSSALLLACVTSVLIWPLHQATTIIYRGCAYRAVVGKEQALWFCLADNLCAMFHCQDNNVFSLNDCGCVPPHSITSTNSLNGSKNGGGGGGGGSGSGRGGDSSMTFTTSTSTTTLSLLSSTPSVVISGVGGGMVTSPVPPLSSSTYTSTSTSTSSPLSAECQPEIHIDGLSATRVAGGRGLGGPRSVYVEPHRVIDLLNGSAFYDGYSYLAIPMYANARFDSGFTVEFVLQEELSALRQVLMTNCKHGQGASVEIILDVELGVILFHLMYRFRGALSAMESVVQVAVPYTPFTTKHVALVFDGRTLTGRVNHTQRSNSIAASGDYVMAKRAKPLMFGNTLCDVDDAYSYRGQITQISIYRCAKDLSRGS